MELRRKVSGDAARFRSLLAGAAGIQQRMLREILARNRDCEYARRYGFAGIRSYEEFRSQVPVVTYEALRADIGRLEAGERGVLLGSDVLAFEETGGAAGGRKLIPHTKASLDAFRRALRVWLDDLCSNEPQLASGTAYWAISPACRAPRACAARVPIGIGDAQYFGEDLAADVARILSVPPAVATLGDFEDWRYATTAHLLADESLAWISVWSPTFLRTLLQCAVDHGARLVERHAGSERSARVRAALTAQVPDFRAIWPNLRLISCWDQASSQLPARDLAAAFPGVTLQGKGLLATEGIVSIPLGGWHMPVLAIESGFYEFVADDGTPHAAWELTPGAEYEVLLTNDSGLYRYAIGDRVRVHEYAGGAPTLEFVGRCGVISDLCGEKLTESFVLSALASDRPGFCVLAADSDRYVLLLDEEEISPHEAAPLCVRVDAALERNPQYAYARRVRQLAPVRPEFCRRPMDNFVTAALRQGRRLGDLKTPVLHTTGEWRRIFNAVQP